MRFYGGDERPHPTTRYIHCHKQRDALIELKPPTAKLPLILLLEALSQFFFILTVFDYKSKNESTRTAVSHKHVKCIIFAAILIYLYIFL